AMAFPNKPIVMVVPYSAGGSTDVLARLLAEAMSRDLGQQVVVENVGGAGGTIGSSKVVRAPNDGHTILFHNMGLATSMALYKDLNFDPRSDLEPVALAGDVPMILVRNKHIQPCTVDEQIDYTQNQPSKVNLTNARLVAATHQCAPLQTQTGKMDMAQWHYRGTALAL